MDLPDLLVLHIFRVLEGLGCGSATLLVDFPRFDTILLDLSDKRPSKESTYDWISVVMMGDQSNGLMIWVEK